MPAERRGLIDDNFGVLNGQEPFAVNGWRNFSPLVGPSNIVVGDWLSTPPGRSYLWAYGCGGGTYTSASGIGTTWNLVTNATPFVFTMLFGSYFGDCDSQDNFLRAQLAGPGRTLSCVWAGRPYWYFHDMGLGETIGFSARVCQDSTYGDSPGVGMVHVALLGDPTLRMHPVGPPGNLRLATNGSGGLDLAWTASSDLVRGYHVYRAPAANASGPFIRLTTNLLTTTSWTVAAPAVESDVYMVRAVKLEESPSGSYFNASQGILRSLDDRVGSPWIALHEPTNNSAFARGAVIRVAANLLDPAVTVTNVSFFANDLKLGEAAGPAASFIWSNAPVGIHLLTARATTTSGFQTNSAPVTVRIDHGGSPTLAIWPVGLGSNLISGDDVLGRVYRLEFTETIPGANWQILGNATSGPAGSFQYLDTFATNTHRYYRTAFP